jgi:starch phosphorylase
LRRWIKSLSPAERAAVVPRVCIFGGKAAPGYDMAKRIIRLIHRIAARVNSDPDVGDLFKVVFIPNYNVSLAEIIVPASDISQHISTAGMEASGTSNMKFAMNGGSIIGTMDGANIEIRDEVGAENFFLFGMSTPEVAALRVQGYRPADIVETNDEVREVLNLVRDGFFSRGNTELFQPLVDNLLQHDPYMVLADYQAYADCQQRVNLSYRDTERWTCMSIMNTARSGKFSSDRTIREYCAEIWRVRAVPVKLLTQEEVKSGLIQ